MKKSKKVADKAKKGSSRNKAGKKVAGVRAMTKNKASGSKNASKKTGAKLGRAKTGVVKKLDPQQEIKQALLAGGNETFYHGLLGGLSKTDKRKPLYLKQLKERGFDDTETWNLDVTVSKFLLPRLSRFKEISLTYPPDLTPETWSQTLGKMMLAMSHLSSHRMDEVAADEQLETKEREGKIKKIEQEIEEGLDLFRKYYRDLWW